MRRSNKVVRAINGRMNSTKAKYDAKYATREVLAMCKHTGVKIITCGVLVWLLVEYCVYRLWM